MEFIFEIALFANIWIITEYIETDFNPKSILLFGGIIMPM